MSTEKFIYDLVSEYHSSQDYKEIAWFYDVCSKIDPKVVKE